MVIRCVLLFVAMSAALRAGPIGADTPPVQPGAPLRYPVGGVVLAPTGLLTDGGAPLRGVATWYDDGPGLYAAAGPVLRRALGGDPAFRGQRVTVCSGGRCVTVRLTDWCACGSRDGKPTLLDLSIDAFARLASVGRGVIPVRVSALGGLAAPTAPPTDVAP